MNSSAEQMKDGLTFKDGMSYKVQAADEPAVEGFHPVIPVGKTWNVLDLTKGYLPEAISLDPPSIGRYDEKRTNMYITGLFGGVRNIHMGLDIWVPENTPVHAISDGRVLFFRDNDNPGDYGPTIVTEHKIGPQDAIYSHYTHGAGQGPGQGATQGAGRTAKTDAGQGAGQGATQGADRTAKTDAGKDKRARTTGGIATGINEACDQSDEITLYALFGHLSQSSLEKVTAGMPLNKGQVFAEVGGPQENGGWVPHLHFQLSWELPSEPDMPGVVAEEDHERALVTYPDPRLVLGKLY